jgi:phage terminase large subunit-like protein
MGGIAVVPMKRIHDKRTRLRVAAPFIKNGTVLFPRAGCEQLLGQVFHRGVESHDDLVDGLTYLLRGLADEGLELPKIQ